MLKIKKEIYLQLIKYAWEEAPIEACGYLGGSGENVTEFQPLTNVDAAEDHFRLDPEEQFKVVRNWRAKGIKPLAVFHSHPETPARPSEEDIRLAFDPNISYVILSLEGDTPAIKSFKIRKGVVEPEAVEIVD